MNIKRLEVTDSTNNWVANHEEELTAPSIVYSVSQTSGRGQRGNSWESQPGKNITASLLYHPNDFPACRQFQLSEAVALAIVDFLKVLGVKAKIKWPNDIYVGDEKICGILVEHVVTGWNISRTIAGMGININQKEFTSDAPNPVSVSRLTGKEYDIDEAVEKLGYYLEKYIKNIESSVPLHSRFLELLWRNDGEFYDFYDRKNEEHISARIEDVGEDGLLTLKLTNGDKRTYAFKEVEFLL